MSDITGTSEEVNTDKIRTVEEINTTNKRWDTR